MLLLLSFLFLFLCLHSDVFRNRRQTGSANPNATVPANPPTPPQTPTQSDNNTHISANTTMAVTTTTEKETTTSATAKEPTYPPFLTAEPVQWFRPVFGSGSVTTPPIHPTTIADVSETLATTKQKSETVVMTTKEPSNPANTLGPMPTNGQTTSATHAAMTTGGQTTSVTHAAMTTGGQPASGKTRDVNAQAGKKA